jgi:hypothetical protein
MSFRLKFKISQVRKGLVLPAVLPPCLVCLACLNAVFLPFGELLSLLRVWGGCHADSQLSRMRRRRSRVASQLAHPYRLPGSGISQP